MPSKRGILAAIAVVAVIAASLISVSGFVWVCPFRSFTGLMCPGCGGRTALLHLLDGEFLWALETNALAVIVLPCALVSLALAPKHLRFALVMVIVAIVLAHFILRNFFGFSF